MYIVIYTKLINNEDIDTNIVGIHSETEQAENQVKQCLLESLNEWKENSIISNESDYTKRQWKSGIDNIIGNLEKDCSFHASSYFDEGSMFSYKVKNADYSTYIRVLGPRRSFPTGRDFMDTGMWKIQKVLGEYINKE